MSKIGKMERKIGEKKSKIGSGLVVVPLAIDTRNLFHNFLSLN